MKILISEPVLDASQQKMCWTIKNSKLSWCIATLRTEFLNWPKWKTIFFLYITNYCYISVVALFAGITQIYLYCYNLDLLLFRNNKWKKTLLHAQCIVLLKMQLKAVTVLFIINFDWKLNQAFSLVVLFLMILSKTFNYIFRFCMLCMW